ncbi:MAG TPA: hypothetical protein VF897_21660, partial [Roseiflexaceae bacterium]
MLPISYIGIHLAFHVMNVLLYSDARVAEFTVSAAFFAVLSVEYLQPLARARAWICRPPLVLLTLLTWLPLLWFSESWSVPPVTFGGIVLLRLRAPVSWWAFGGVVAVQWPLWFALAPGGLGERISLSAYFVFGAFASGLIFYGFGRLAGMVVAVQAAQGRLTEQAVLAERLRAARDLDGLLGTALTGIADRGRAALRIPDGAGVVNFHSVVRTAREALTKARALASGYHDRIALADEGGAEIRPQLALPILISVHAGNVVWHIASQPLQPDGLAGGTLVLFATLLIAIFGLQVRHTVLRARLAGTVGAYATLAVQAALTGAALAIRPLPMSVTLGFLIGSILLLVPARWSWPLSGTLMAGAICYANFAGGLHGWELARFIMVVVHLTVVVYGLTTLNELARRLQDARGELAAMAVLSERLRFARDVHDLYGLT